MRDPNQPIKGRGSAINPAGRFEATEVEAFDDGWFQEESEQPRPKTQVSEETARSAISWNESPDICFDRSLNPYRGCEHGCSYCYARPTYSYLNLSAGLDFETKLFAKINIAEALRADLAKKNYACAPLHIGGVTDPYQPIERHYQLTRQALQVLAETNHPCSIITKNALVLRDLDLLAPMAEKNLVQVYVSITSLDNHLSAQLEPRASAPNARLRTVSALTAAGVPVGVMVAPVIPFITDAFMERIIEAAADAGASGAGYVLLRLPYEVKTIFRNWLSMHYPERAERVMAAIHQVRAGKDNDSRFGTRMSGEGLFAELFKKRFNVAKRKAPFTGKESPLATDLFKKPSPNTAQLSLGF